MTPEQADYIMRNLKKQTVGAALFAIGYYGSNGIGGYYQEGDSKKLWRPKAGTVDGAPAWTVHSPALDMLQMGATVRRLQQEKNSTAEGVYQGAKGALLEVPLFDGVSELTSGLKNYTTAGKFVGQQVKGAVIPPLVSQSAKWTDKANSRKASTFTDELKSGIPGLRETLPAQ